MTAAAPLLQALSEYASDSAQVPASPEEAAFGAKRRWLDAVEDLANRAQEARRRNSVLREKLERFVVALKEDSSGVDLDEVIDKLQSSEREVVTSLKPWVDKMKATRKGTFSMRGSSPGEKARAIAAVDHYIKILNEGLEVLRDYRWQIMTIRADHEDPGDAPVFDDPEQLERYITAHSR